MEPMLILLNLILLTAGSLFFILLAASSLLEKEYRAASISAAGLVANTMIWSGFLRAPSGMQALNWMLLAVIVVFALISWLAARSLEAALQELREINQRLDELVDERTKELAEANKQLAEQASELAEVNVQLTELDRLKSKFVSDVSHELRTPISNLTIYLEMLGFATPDKRARYLAVLQEETSRLDKLISDILDLSRMEMGTTKVDLGWIDINKITDQVIVANQPRAEVKDVTLTFNSTPENPKVWGDANQMHQAINNLVGNAVNYTSEGNIWVSTHLDTETELLRLQVKDTGFGIAPKDVPHLFERFYRGEQAGQSTIPGTGLGLAITKEIIDGHRGRIEVESVVDEGSTFTIFLPLGRPDSDDAVVEKGTI